MPRTIVQLLILALFSLFSNLALAQDLPVESIKKMIAELKVDERGPYYRIKWFCEDSTIRDARDPCPDSIGGGIQHATYKPVIQDWMKKYHLYVGEILATANHRKFYDKKNRNSRLKQYQLNQYLKNIDDGWVLQKAQYYRGAVQSEDEAEWGIEFYEWLLSDIQRLDENYYLIRQSMRDIPHKGEEDRFQDIRNESKLLAEIYPKFMDLRTKIHGAPEPSDLKSVNSFKDKHADKLDKKGLALLDSLRAHMTIYYQPIDRTKITHDANLLPVSAYLKRQINYAFTEDSEYIDSYIKSLSDVLCMLRLEASDEMKAKDRIRLLDFSLKIEDILRKSISEWEPYDLYNLLEKNNALIQAAYGSGLIEQWEFDALQKELQLPQNVEDIKLKNLMSIYSRSRNVVSWATALVKATYDDVILQYTSFEPLASGFIDDKIRSSVALPLGQSVSTLGVLVSRFSEINNKVLDLSGTSEIIGLNAGIAKGELVVVDQIDENFKYNKNNIYVFNNAPADMKPVAGILTVSEGNLVSHVQLLARNLGIPNVSINDDHFKALKEFHGKEVFLAVSDKGSVKLIEADKMSKKESKLYEANALQRIVVTVNTDDINLADASVLNMRDVSADDSGFSCGPKAANLGELKSMFPEQVVEGIIIPFGIFRAHMDQTMPNSSDTYWCFLNETFAEAEYRYLTGASEADVEVYQLNRLAELQAAIYKIQLKPDFIADLKEKFQTVLGNPIGKIPVFLRSDTNMEDLESFTGAGLNLTLFNILEEDKIIEGIKKVWASPYTERSFKWRQQYLTNPENVFPSILIIPSVDVEYSGVLITQGINEGTEQDMTAAFSRGAGGAVDGQMAELRLITADNNILLNPSRSTSYIRLPTTGGVKRYAADFNQPILSDRNIMQIRSLTSRVRSEIPARTKSNYKGAYDIELGFLDNKLWLFQIRPFVENENALISDYLQSISPNPNLDKKVSLKNEISI